MNSRQREKIISHLINTSVDDCRTSLDGHHDAGMLCDLLIACHLRGHKAREQIVRQRISKLIKKAK